MGLKPPANKETFPILGYGRRTIRDLVGLGSKFEDSRSNRQALRHFYEATTGSALMIDLALPTLPSPHWATETDNAYEDTAPPQDYSLRDGRRYLFSALTDPDSGVRESKFGLALITLGHVVHHLQDMAQPQHVRNDPHCDSIACLLAERDRQRMKLYAPSLYEKFTATDVVAASLFFGLSDYPAVYDDADVSTIAAPRRFWNTEPPGPLVAGMGIAEYTSRGFVSAGTNFDSIAPGRRQYLLPRLSGAVREWVNLAELCQSDLRVECPSGAKGDIQFIMTDVEDALRPSETRRNRRASTYSIFDEDLKRVGSGRRIYALNRFNLLEAHRFLLPRAVGYSAGLINYFFRGRIDLEREPGKPGLWRIRNLGPETMEGRFALYYDDKDGVRRAVDLPSRWASMSVGAKGAESDGDVIKDLQFTPPASPPPANPGEYMLVFSGTMGQEAPRESSKYPLGQDGAVVGRQIRKGALVGTSSAGSGSMYRAWKSEDSGKSWEMLGSFTSREGARLIYLGGQTLLTPGAKSTDGGLTWTGLASADGLWNRLRDYAALLPDGRLVGSIPVFDEQGKWRPKIAHSSDGGETWGPLIDAIGLGEGISELVTTASGAVYTHTSYYVRTEPCPPPLDNLVCDIYRSGFHRSLDEGRSWHLVFNDALGKVAYIGKYIESGNGIRLDPNGKETLLANYFVRLAPYTYRQDVMRSMDGGFTWTPVPVPAEIANTTHDIWRLAYGGDGAVYAYAHNTGFPQQHWLYKSGDGGSTWSLAESLPPNTQDAGLYGLAMVPRTGEIPGFQMP
jgi:hypothetical protein